MTKTPPLQELEQILIEVFETGYEQGLAGQTGAVKLMLSNHAQYRILDLIRKTVLEVIGEDDLHKLMYPSLKLNENGRGFDKTWTDEHEAYKVATIKDQLRASQRKHLDKILGGKK